MRPVSCVPIVRSHLLILVQASKLNLWSVRHTLKDNIETTCINFIWIECSGRRLVIGQRQPERSVLGRVHRRPCRKWLRRLRRGAGRRHALRLTPVSVDNRVAEPFAPSRQDGAGRRSRTRRCWQLSMAAAGQIRAQAHYQTGELWIQQCQCTRAPHRTKRNGLMYCSLFSKPYFEWGFEHRSFDHRQMRFLIAY